MKTNSFLQNKKKLVIKIGSSLLVEKSKLRKTWLKKFAADVVELIKKEIDIIIVTSGAIACGRLNLKTKKRKLSLEEKQAAAAVGQVKLMMNYTEIFSTFGLNVAQILLNAADCNSRKRYLNSQNTINTLLKNHIIPIINENDSITIDGIKIGDNDRLAARIAQMISADLLILFSDIDGLYDKNPRQNKSAKFIPKVSKITKETENMAGNTGSSVGTGGMITKIQAAKMAALANCETIITNGIEAHPLKKLFSGEKKFTIFAGKKSLAKSRKKWLSGFFNATGEVTVNDLAKETLLNKKVSLLPVGVIAAKGKFEVGDAIFIKDTSGNHIASGISNYSILQLRKILRKNSTEIKKIFGNDAKTELVHIDNLVIVG